VSAEDAARAQHSGEVGVEDGIPFVVAHVERRATDGAAGGVDENIDLAERLDDDVGKRLQRRRIRHVGRRSERASSARFYLSGGARGKLRSAAGRDDVGAGVGESERDCAADARRRANDDGGAVGEIEEC
jgi:hypothetical protein